MPVTTGPFGSSASLKFDVDISSSPGDGPALDDPDEKSSPPPSYAGGYDSSAPADPAYYGDEKKDLSWEERRVGG